MTTIRIPDLNNLARYREPCAELTERVRAGDELALTRARDVLAELDVIAAQFDAAFHEAGGDRMTTPGLELVYALAGSEDLSVVIDVIDEPGANRAAWQRLEPLLRAKGWTDAELAAERERSEVPA